MDFLLKARQAGKSTDIVRRAAATGSFIVVLDHAQAYQLVQLAESLGLSIPFPLTWREFTQRRYKTEAPVYIDNLDMILQDIAGYSSIAAVTATEEEQP